MIDVDLNDAKPLRTLPDNSEHKLTIIRAETTENRSKPSEWGVSNLHLWLDCGESDVDDIQVWLPIPNEVWKAELLKDYTKAMIRFKEFCQACSFTPPLDASRLVGLSGWAVVTEEEDDRNPGRFRNGVRNWVVR